MERLSGVRRENLINIHNFLCRKWPYTYAHGGAAVETNGGLQTETFGYTTSDNDRGGATVELYDAYRTQMGGKYYEY